MSPKTLCDILPNLQKFDIGVLHLLARGDISIADAPYLCEPVKRVSGLSDSQLFYHVEPRVLEISAPKLNLDPTGDYICQVRGVQYFDWFLVGDSVLGRKREGSVHWYKKSAGVYRKVFSGSPKLTEVTCNPDYLYIHIP